MIEPVSLLFLGLFILGMADLARRFGVSPLWAVLLAAVTPAMVLSVRCASPVLPPAAFQVLAVAALLRGIDSRNGGWFFFAVLCVAAMFYCAAPHLAASLSLLKTLNKGSPIRLFFRFMMLLQYLGASTVFPLSLILLGWRRNVSQNLALAGMVFVSALFGFFLVRMGYSPLRAAASAAMLTAAQAGIEHLLIRPMEEESPDNRLIIFWFGAGFLAALLRSGAGLLMVPAWILLYLRRAEAGPAREWIPATLLATLAMALFKLR